MGCIEFSDFFNHHNHNCSPVSTVGSIPIRSPFSPCTISNNFPASDTFQNSTFPPFFPSFTILPSNSHSYWKLPIRTSFTSQLCSKLIVYHRVSVIFHDPRIFFHEILPGFFLFIPVNTPKIPPQKIPWRPLPWQVGFSSKGHRRVRASGGLAGSLANAEVWKRKALVRQWEDVYIWYDSV